MARGVPALLGFNAGELSPLMDARTDQDKYNLGCKTLTNFLCTVQGPAVRRGGTRFIGMTKNNQLAWLSRFIFSRNQSYILEWGNGYLRFWTQRAQLLNSSNVPYEIITPWTYAQLTTTDGTFALQMVQSGDVVYITHASGTYPVYKLSRLGATNWTLQPVTFTGGPWQDVDPNNTTITVTPSALGTLNNAGVEPSAAAVTLTANTPIFQLGHVGSLFLMEIIDYSGYPAWQSNTTVAAGAMWQYDGNVYIAQSAATYNSSTGQGGTGRVPPTHLEGTQSDGSINWLYAHSGYGWIQILGYSSATSVTGVIQARLPGNGVNTALDGSGETAVAFTRYAFQVFNGVDGYPVALDFHMGRLCLGMGRYVLCSSSGIFEDHSPKTGFQVIDSNAINVQVGLKEIDQIRWMASDRDLLIGTDNFEFTIQNQSPNLVFSPSNVQTRSQTNIGTRLLQPLQWANATLFCELSGQRVREAKYTYTIDRYQAEDISVLAEHISAVGVIDWCMQRDHDPVIWNGLADGSLGGVTYNRDRNVIAWHRHYLGGFNNAAHTLAPFVNALESIPDPSSTRDDVWMVVERFINGQVVHYIEVLEDYNLLLKGQQYAYFVDCGLTYNGTPASVISGLDHLNGETVQVFADGGRHPDCVVNNGSITLNSTYSIVSIGLQFVSTLQTMRIEFGAQDGSAQTRMKSVSECLFRFRNTIGGQVGSKPLKLFPLKFRPPGLQLGTPIPLFNGDILQDLDGGWDRDGFIFVQQTGPLPMTLVAIYPRVTTND